ncbi:thiopeptide-type bacteriocin biosynthesis protein [Flavobacterium hydatis]|nr:thiopeptide-type bacteriocin biosynthesis protein [Flavobacterium hydatis]
MQKVKRTFILGEEWLYYKIYCGNYSADRVLTESILPIVDELIREKIILQWFFVRYNDPNNHLRLRFKMRDVNDISKVIKLMQFHFSGLIDDDLVIDVVTATYKREMERYGETTIELVEKLYYYHSKKTVSLISNTTPKDDEIARVFASLQMINDLLENFNIPLNNRISFVESIQQAYKKEQQIDKENNKKLDFLYRTYRNEIVLFLQEKQEPVYLEGLIDMVKITPKEIDIIKEIINRKSSPISEDFISSLIHMNINRVFRSKQRHYEMLCYDFMNRFYKNIAARI